MLSDEEREALEILELYFGENSALNITKYVNIALNLIEKQSKEIEELKDTRSIFNMGRRSYKNEIEDKIKAKIEEYKKQQKEEPDAYLCIKVLSSLLEKE